jgi:hypothetical protein
MGGGAGHERIVVDGDATGSTVPCKTGREVNAVSIDTNYNGADTAEGDTDLLGVTVDRLRELEGSLTEDEKRLAAQLSDVRQKKTATERALGIFTGTTPAKKRRGRPRKTEQN